MNNQASPKPTGRELRRARNVVRKWVNDRVEFLKENGPQPAQYSELYAEVRAKRYDRACALILADKLRNS